MSYVLRKKSLGIAMDLGTSGLRAQAVHLSTGAIISTAITTHHPLPGANVIDHLHFALEMGQERAGRILIRAVNAVIGKLGIQTERIGRMGICGNPIQVSLFQGIEIRDLAYAGKRKLESLGVSSPKRDAEILSAGSIPGLNLPPECEVVIPPAVCHEIGADALAMIIQTGMLEKDETALATDYGTNAEMALYHNGHIFTGSAAAGPALEGQQIECGMLAAPGVITDLVPDPPFFREIVLDSEMLPQNGPLVDIRTGRMVDKGELRPAGITGTGTIALIQQAVEAGLISDARITTPDIRLHLGKDIYFTETDFMEAGKAIGALRAGYITLCHEAGIASEEIRTAYMSGASGTYVDARKAWKIGMTPPRVEKMIQAGNTSLAMARELVTDLENLEKMGRIAEQLKATHVMFAGSDMFKKIYILELSYWTEGMPMKLYRKFLKKYGIPDLLPLGREPEVIRRVTRDISDTGTSGLVTLHDIGEKVWAGSPESCVLCKKCVKVCPEGALSHDPEGAQGIILNTALCNGVACRKCETACPEKIYELKQFFLKKGGFP